MSLGNRMREIARNVVSNYVEGSTLFKPGDTIRRKGGQRLYTVWSITEEIALGYRNHSAVVESELGLQTLHHLEYYELVDPPQVVAGYMELFV